MELKKVWMSPDTGKKSRYGVRILGGSFGIALLVVLLICGGTFLILELGAPIELSSTVLGISSTVLGIVLALRLGQRATQDAMIFFLTESDKLYAVDSRTLSTNHFFDLAGFTASTMETQAFLRRQAQQPFVPAGADELLKVLNIKENRSYYAIRCMSRKLNGHVIRRTYILVKGSEDEEELLRELERRESWENALEPVEKPNLRYALLSTLVLVCCVILCILSHSALAKLPQVIYYPCLGAAVLALYFVLYFILRYRRGE